MSDQQGEWLRLRDAAAALDVSVDTVRRWQRRDKIEARQDDRGRWEVFVEDEKRRTTGRLYAAGEAPPTDWVERLMRERERAVRAEMELAGVREENRRLTERLGGGERAH